MPDTESEEDPLSDFIRETGDRLRAEDDALRRGYEYATEAERAFDSARGRHYFSAFLLWGVAAPGAHLLFYGWTRQSWALYGAYIGGWVLAVFSFRSSGRAALRQAGNNKRSLVPPEHTPPLYGRRPSD